MLRRIVLVLAAVTTVLGLEGAFAQKAGAGAAPQLLRIDWLGESTTSTAQTPEAARTAVARLAGTSGARHFVVQFTHGLDASERELARQSGLRLLAYLGNHAWFASASAATLDLQRMVGLPLADAREVQRSWKLQPMLERGEVPEWTVVERKGDTPTVAVYVLFHPDVARGEQETTILLHGGVVRDVVLSVNGVVVELPFDAIHGLAEEDGVQYVEPALPRMGTVNAENRALTGVDAVQSSYGLDGSGVTAMVYDAGTARATHLDFGGRLTARDGSGVIQHSTHVAGTIGGDGTASGGVNSGMAPGVTIESYGFEFDGSGTFLYTNPGDFEVDYADAIMNHGADVSNNSIGTNTETNGFNCSYQGDYGLMSSLIDAVVRGSVSGGVPYRIVWAAGNERQGSRCDVEGFGDYYSTAPPAGAKNHLAIGAVNANDDSMTYFSSWGPTDDGRLKPDFCAPGCQIGGDGGVTSCSSSSDTAYIVFCGTSMASPTVTGIVALMLQDYRNTFPGPDPRNSTLKVLLAHSAVDRGNDGPDYQFGYGSVRAPAAIDLMRSGNFYEKEVDQGETQFFTAVVSASDPELKVTLAWDDYPGTPNTAVALIDDLDLHVFSPSGVEHFPWTLDPVAPANAATRVTRDRVDNIEQVRVDSPEPGSWRIEVRGYDVPQGPQSFSICATPVLMQCGSLGLVALDHTAYSCGATAGVQVIDCDLNLDDGQIDTVDVSVTSDSELAGETLTLYETGTATAVFSAPIPLDVVDAMGVLLVAEGDSIHASYLDADDGNGNVDVMRTADATIDCTGPVISNLAVSNVTATSATIDFDTDEPASGQVDYGTTCGAFTDHRVSSTGMHHTLQLTGLADGTDHYFRATASDPAQNATVDDNGGNCYTFTTADVPDAFTEQFTSGFDMSGRRLTLTPDGSLEGYVACTRRGTGFPTDPTGGTTIVLSDDDSRLVNIGGGQTVQLYGVAYDHFYVGSNGYLTFTGTDTDYTESIGDHFDTPRISVNFDDYNPSAGGQVSWKQLSDHVAVTWSNVPEYSTTNSNSFQAELYFDGRIRLAWLGMESEDGLVGLSAGLGTPSPFLPSDVSEYSCPLNHLFEQGPASVGDGGRRNL